MVANVTTGRGAWTAIGKDNKAKYYQATAPLDGSAKDRDVNYQAVNFGVLAIQKRVNTFGYSPALIEDGIYGKGTAAGVSWVQKKLGITVSGQVGPSTAKALWRDYLIWFGGVYHVPASQMYGFMMLESVGDPGAVGYTTPSDRGICQINLVAHPDVSVEQAFDPVFNLNYTAKRLSDARIKYSGKTPDLKNKCSIAQHNAPLWANQWYQTGSPPNEKIKTYVDKVLGYALEF